MLASAGRSPLRADAGLSLSRPDIRERSTWPKSTPSEKGRYNHPAMSTTKTFTDEELMRLPKDGKYELVNGEIRMSPAGGRHGRISLRLGARLLAFVDEKQLGMVFESSTGF